ncbi:MAG: hypothetical protein KGI00_03115 [Candidatus Micrarchaeota archaeon]|nr:hypothetical protein [Candidatus Micrarchaeota archaeon]MDE1849695.1 hypothetical protein [Candidatus Micrarchaeota archaeon]
MKVKTDGNLKAFLNMYPQMTLDERVAAARGLRQDSPIEMWESLASDDSSVTRRIVASKSFISEHLRKHLENDDMRQVRKEALRTREFQMEVKAADLAVLLQRSSESKDDAFSNVTSKVAITIGSATSAVGTTLVGIGAYYMFKNGVATPHEGNMMTAGTIFFSAGSFTVYKSAEILRRTRHRLSDYLRASMKIKEWNRESKHLHSEAKRLNRQLECAVPMALYKDSQWFAVERIERELDSVNEQITERAIISVRAKEIARL